MDMTVLAQIAAVVSAIAGVAIFSLAFYRFRKGI
jgi:hypothetical protein